MTRAEDALGMVETHGLTAAIEAADAMLKTADVRLVAVEQTVAALMTVQVVGEVAAVQAAVAAGRYAAERVGRVVSAHVIPRAASDVRAMLGLDGDSVEAAGSSSPSMTSSPGAPTQEAPIASGDQPSAEELSQMTVRELRALARSYPDFPVQGRAIAKTKKGDLIEQLIAYLGDA